MHIKWDFFKKKKNWVRILGGLGAFFLISLIFLFIAAEKKMNLLVVDGLGESFSTKVFSAPYRIKNHSYHSPEIVLERCKRLGYKEAEENFLNPGEYFFSPPHISIYFRGFETPTFVQNALLVTALVNDQSQWTLSDIEGHTVLEVSLEPELVAELSGKNKVRREFSPWEEIPENLINAVVAAEDHRFFHHFGIRPLSIFRAFVHNVRSSGPTHGGSTITQQLAKNLFLTPERTIRRKILEAFLAVYLEIRLSKEKILTIYLNHIYMGQDGFYSVAGMKSAAELYFSKDLSQLTLGECAVLAGMIRSPYRYNPVRNPEKALNRRNFVLKNMLKQKMISTEEYFDTQNQTIKTEPGKHSEKSFESSEYYIGEILRRLLPLYGDDVLFRYGFEIFTAMDPLYQEWAQSAVKKVRYQGALVALDPETGNVQALVGGKDYSESQFHRATQALRQPGSAFKPFVYGTALEKGIRASDFINDVFRTYKSKDEEDWGPKNFDGVYRGSVTVRQALQGSMNAATLDLARKIGVQNVVDFAQRLGIESPLEPSLALALGAYEVTLLELTSAYAPFVNGGFQIRPIVVVSVVDAQDNVIEIDTPKKKSVLAPSLSFLVTSLLESVVKEGTARRLAALGWVYPSAGKTGTTNGGKDAWFIGFTPRLLAGVWVGHDQAKAIRVSGSGYAVPIWAEFMKKAHHGLPLLPFVPPNDVKLAKIDPLSGLLARSGCPETIEESYLRGTAPREKCPLHSGGIKGWFKKVFRKSSKKPEIQ